MKLPKNIEFKATVLKIKVFAPDKLAGSKINAFFLVSARIFIYSFNFNFSSDIEMDFPELERLTSVSHKQPGRQSHVNAADDDDDSVLDLKLPKRYSRRLCDSSKSCQVL